MKKHLLFITSVLGCVAAVAQPTINLVDMTPAIGETIEIATTEYTEPGAGGANQVWNFSDLPVLQDLSFSVEDPLGYLEPYLDGTTHVYVTSSYGDVEYMRFADNKVELLFGDYDGFFHVHSDGQSFLEFPLILWEVFDDTYEFGYFGLGAEDSDTETGVSTTLVDGYGTLELPNGTFTDVIRLTTVINGSREVIFHSDVVIYYDFVETTVRFVSAGIHTELLKFVSRTIGSETATTSATMYVGEPLGIEESDAITDFNLYPSPASDFVQMDFNLEASSELTMKLMTIDGRIVDEAFLGQTPAGTNQIRFDLPSVSSGIYLMHIDAEDGVYTHRLMIE